METASLDESDQNRLDRGMESAQHLLPPTPSRIRQNEIGPQGRILPDDDSNSCRGIQGKEKEDCTRVKRAQAGNLVSIHPREYAPYNVC